MRVERLEDRTLLSVQFFFDYSRYATGFFSDAQRRQVLELAGQQLSSRLNDTLLEINQSTFDNGLYQWTAQFTNPATGQADEAPGLVVPQDTIYVFVGARDLGGLLAIGGPGGFQVVGPPPLQPWFDHVKARGQTGALQTPATDYATWGGQLTFDSSANWHFGTTTTGLDPGEADFFSVAIHELAHLIGFGIADSWDALLNGTSFTGTQAVAEYDGTGNVPVAPDLAHWAEGTQDEGQETAMDPSLYLGTRKLFTPLDFAGLADIGWEVVSNDTYTITVADGVGHTIVVSDDGDPSNGLSQVTIDGVPTTFVNPTTSLIINGADNDDTITVNPLDSGFAATIVVNGGAGNDAFIINPEASSSITVNGDAGNDSLTFPLGAADSVTHTFAGPTLGSVAVTTNSQTTTVNYIGLEPIIDNLAAIDRVFYFGLSADDVTLNDNDIADDGLSRLSSVSSSERVDFIAPTGSLTINTSSGDDTVRLLAVDSLLAAPVLVETGDGNDVVDASAMWLSVTLKGQAGDDTLIGGSGNDLLQDDSGQNWLIGSGGDDLLAGGIGPDLLDGGVGRDSLFGSADTDTLQGGDGDDLLYGQGNGDSLEGGGGNDLLRGRVGDDTLSGGSGDDTIDGEDGTDQVVETADTDWILTDTSLIGLGTDSLISIERAALTAGPGDNTLTAVGFSGRTTLDGAAGDDVLIGGDGNDRLLGGSGLNLVSGGLGDDTLAGGLDRDTLFGDFGADYLLGSAGGDFLDGGPGNDYLRGQGGSNDSLTGGDGDDTLDGGPGSDWLLEFGDADFVLTDTALSGLGNDRLISVERAGLALTGTAGRMMSAAGFTGRATLLGGPGDDTLAGGPGDDRLLAKDGNNLVFGGPGADLLGGGLGRDTLFGEDGNDRLFASAGADFLDGGPGDDEVIGQGGSNDTLTGGEGNDTLNGGPGTDLLTETADADLTLTDTQLIGLGTDVLVSMERAWLEGGAGNNRLDASGFNGLTTLRGLDGDDTLIAAAGRTALSGGPGNDRLEGGPSADTLVGGLGNDTLFGGDENDLLLGSDGDDWLDGQTGDQDTLGGGPGDDTYDDPNAVIDDLFAFDAPWI